MLATVSCHPDFREWAVSQSDELAVKDSTALLWELQLGEFLGQGSFATVYSAESEKLRRDFPRLAENLVAKVYLPEKEGSVESAAHEAQLLSKLSGCPHVVGFAGFFVGDVHNGSSSSLFEQKGLYMMLMELCQCSLQDVLYHLGTLTENYAAFVGSSVLKGLMHIHKKGILHRDIQAGNILFAENGSRVVLSDFGLSVCASNMDRVEWRSGTPGYVAPEVWLYKVGGRKSEVFSVGVLLYLSLALRLPFKGANHKETAHITVTCAPDMEVLGKRSRNCRAFITQLLQRQPDQRPSPKHAIENEWLASCIEKMEASDSPEVRAKQFETVCLLRQQMHKKKDSQPDAKEAVPEEQAKKDDSTKAAGNEPNPQEPAEQARTRSAMGPDSQLPPEAETSSSSLHSGPCTGHLETGEDEAQKEGKVAQGCGMDRQTSWMRPGWVRIMTPWGTRDAPTQQSGKVTASSHSAPSAFTVSGSFGNPFKRQTSQIVTKADSRNVAPSTVFTSISPTVDRADAKVENELSSGSLNSGDSLDVEVDQPKKGWLRMVSPWSADKDVIKVAPTHAPRVRKDFRKEAGYGSFVSPLAVCPEDASIDVCQPGQIPAMGG